MTQLASALDDESLFAPELYMQHFVLRALIASGQDEAAMRRARRYWFPIIETVGWPTIWEMNVQQHSKSAFHGTGSLCHGFACTPIEFLQGVVLGVSHVTDGYDEFVVAPHTFHLTEARGTVPTPLGTISVAWEKRIRGDGRHETHGQVTVPDGATALLPGANVVTRHGAGTHSFLVP